ncbi:hypothetical protein TW95_gp0159 [Pandoravirus inopinatum]|uniref:Uncharacterized protein n=1 Tax=Pandoravirus inopinatum TaxID=1605721 RepID=A0A0B5IW41_9VIRU|nr:hypothetical protein TW95_gp0159 [Pandoravirus inopinatum]AJF96893.1 hypothetical protein [Pandoravirus inopinatum]
MVLGVVDEARASSGGAQKPKQKEGHAMGRVSDRCNDNGDDGGAVPLTWSGTTKSADDAASAEVAQHPFRPSFYPVGFSLFFFHYIFLCLFFHIGAVRKGGTPKKIGGAHLADDAVKKKKFFMLTLAFVVGPAWPRCCLKKTRRAKAGPQARVLDTKSRAFAERKNFYFF